MHFWGEAYGSEPWYPHSSWRAFSNVRIYHRCHPRNGALGTPRQKRNLMPKLRLSWRQIEQEGRTYIVMYEISLFYVQILKFVIAAPQTSDIYTKSRRLFMKAEHSLDVISPLALGQSSPSQTLALARIPENSDEEKNLPFSSSAGALGGTDARGFSRLQVAV